MKEVLILDYLFKFPYAIPSINQYLMPKRGGGFYMNPKVRKFKEDIKRQLYESGIDQRICKAALSSTRFPNQFKCNIVYLLNSNRNIRDEDNLRKCLQDSIAEYFNYNDILITSAVTDRAIISSNNSTEFIKYQLYIHDKNLYYDLRTPVPSTVPLFDEGVTHKILYSIKKDLNMELSLKDKIANALRLYNQGLPTGMSDEAYDSLVNEYGYENYLKDIRAIVNAGEIPHRTEELQYAPRKIQVNDYNECEYDEDLYSESYKLDGCSIIAYYQDGKLDMILTRSNDYTGFDKTEYLRSKFPDTVDKDVFAIQAEAVTTLESFGQGARSKANGLVNSYKLSDQVEEFLFCIPFNVITHSSDKNYYDRLALLGEFSNLDYKYDKSNPGWIKCKYGTVPIDGIVIWGSEFHPEFIYKFYYLEFADTKVKNIEWVRSGFGVYIPKLVIDEVLLQGARINKVATGGYSKMVSLKCGIGSKVRVIRSNSTVPKLLEVLEPSEDYMVPICPSCGNVMLPVSNGVKCLNVDCESEKERLVNYYFDRTGQNMHNITLQGLANPYNIVETLCIQKLNENWLYNALGEYLNHMPEVHKVEDIQLRIDYILERLQPNMKDEFKRLGSMYVKVFADLVNNGTAILSN